MTTHNSSSRGSALPVLLETPESCENCGLCCQGIGSPVLLYQTDSRLLGPHPFRPQDLPQELIQEIDDHFRGLFRGMEPQEQCLWYDPRQKICRHYEWRPEVCRQYETGGPECLTVRKNNFFSVNS